MTSSQSNQGHAQTADPADDGYVKPARKPVTPKAGAETSTTPSVDAVRRAAGNARRSGRARSGGGEAGQVAGQGLEPCERPPGVRARARSTPLRLRASTPTVARSSPSR